MPTSYESINFDRNDLDQLDWYYTKKIHKDLSYHKLSLLNPKQLFFDPLGIAKLTPYQTKNLVLSI